MIQPKNKKIYVFGIVVAILLAGSLQRCLANEKKSFYQKILKYQRSIKRYKRAKKEFKKEKMIEWKTIFLRVGTKIVS